MGVNIALGWSGVGMGGVEWNGWGEVGWSGEGGVK